MKRAIIAVLAPLIASCAQPQQVDVNQLTPDQADCYAKAKAAGASVYNPSIVWQMAQQNETEVAVYNACMRAKQKR